MRRKPGIAIFEAVALFIIGPSAIGGLGVVMLIGPLTKARESAKRAVCMSNLNSINKALIIYKAENDNEYPWIPNVTSDPTAVTTGTNRNKNPHKTEGKPGDRSITSLMFMLVRSGQNPDLFRCPSDTKSVPCDDYRAGKDDGDVKKGDSYWDFADANNVSYSWQAPRRQDSEYVQGIEGDESEMVIAGDMTPAATDPKWKPQDVSKISGNAIQSQNSPNHRSQQNNVLYVAGNVKGTKRPDVGVKKDNIYTASGKADAGSQSATSLDITKHLSTADTFLIGPIGRIEKE